MRRAALLAALLLPALAAAQPALDVEPYRAAAGRLITAALADSSAFERVAYIADTFGPRFSGTENLERAIDWLLEEMEADGLDSVRAQEVMVPRWVRGEEALELVEPRHEKLPMLGLGGSIGTPPEGITAEALVVASFEELEARQDEVPGKIVVYNAPFTSYGETVRYRTVGAIEAARLGAVASLVRSAGDYSLQTPHTGAMRYEEGVPRIPHAALTLEAAEMLSRMQARGQRLVLSLKMEAETLPDVPSRNVIAEVLGRERPEEIVLIGGHIDSWDVGQGAVDDAAGVVVTWEAARLLRALGLRPRRTVRVVAWTNEENGLRGALAYRESLDSTALANHVVALESDFGVFAPVGFGFTGSEEALALIKPIENLIAPLLTESELFGTGIVEGGGGADISPLMRDGVPGMSLNTAAERYFWFHHTAADTVDKLDPGDFARSVAATAVLVYVLAEMPERLPR